MCEAPVPNADGVAKPGALVILGEIHGTEEIPRFVARLACDAAIWRKPIRVGLELPVAEQPALDAFLASDGGADARAALLTTDFWHRELQDGRSSDAMLELLESLRRLRAAVSVFAFDVGKPEGFTSRDLAMAQRVRDERQVAAAEEILIIHTGNVHARLQKGAPWDAQFEPMTWDLHKTFPDLVSLDVSHAGGTAWVCTGATAADCGPRNLTGSGSVDGDGIELFAQPDNFHGRYQVGKITASPPALP
jgi:hypothetical protein